MKNPFDLKEKFPVYFNVWVFRAGVLLVMLCCVYALSLSGFDLEKSYGKIICDNQKGCINEVYICSHPLDKIARELNYIPDCSILKGCLSNCDKKILSEGDVVDFGEKPKFTKNLVLIILIIISATFGINHALYKYRVKE